MFCRGGKNGRRNESITGRDPHDDRLGVIVRVSHSGQVQKLFNEGRAKRVIFEFICPAAKPVKFSETVSVLIQSKESKYRSTARLTRDIRGEQI
jgi:hypothetical protein